MMQLFTFTLIILLVSTERLTIDMYTESLCPDCMLFMKYSLAEATSTPDIDKMVELRVIPYGNARRVYDSKTGVWVFTCQHGAVECYGNIIQLCGMQRIQEKYTENEVLQVEYSECIDRGIFKPYTQTAFNEVAILCARDFGLDSNSIVQCANGEEGYRLHLAAAEETDRLSPAHNYVPWIVANGKHDVTDENQILDNLVKWACDNFKGEKIEACQQYIEY